MEICISKQATSVEVDSCILGTQELLNTAEEMILQIVKIRNDNGRPSGIFTVTVSFEIKER